MMIERRLMTRQLEQRPASNFDSETVVPKTADPGGWAKVCCPRREALGHSCPHLTTATLPLLRRRIRAAALILLTGFTLFLVRHAVRAAANEPFDPILLSCHLLVVAVLGGTAAALCRNRAIPSSWLRFAELVVFGLPAAFFLLLQYKTLLIDAGRNVMSAPSTTWLLLIF